MVVAQLYNLARGRGRSALAAVRAVSVPSLETLLAENNASTVSVGLAIEEVAASGVASVVFGLGVTRTPPVGVNLKQGQPKRENKSGNGHKPAGVHNQWSRRCCGGWHHS